MFGTPNIMEKNGEPASSTLIMLLAWVIETMPKSALVALMEKAGVGKKSSSITETLEDIMYLSTIKTFRNAGQWLDLNQRGYKVEDWLSALNPLPFTLKTLDRVHMVRVHGWENGRSKLAEAIDRAAKTTGELVDGLRNYCEKCDTYVPYLGLDADIVQACQKCFGPTVLKVREVAVSDRYEPRIELPWLIDGMLHKASKVALKTLDGNPFVKVQEALQAGQWNDIDTFVTSTVKKSSAFGYNEKGNLVAQRINALVCRIPVLIDGKIAALWAAVPCGWSNNGMIKRGTAGKKGDLYDDWAMTLSGLSKTEIGRIITFNQTLMARSQLISMLTEKRRKFGNNDHPIVKEWQKRYPASKSYCLKVVARNHDLRNKVIKT